MKFNTILFLGLCAVASASDLFEKVPKLDLIKFEQIPGDSNVPESVEKYILKNVDEFNGLIEMFNALTEDTQDDLIAFANDLQSRVQYSAEQGMSLINDIKPRGGEVALCALMLEKQLATIPGGTWENIKDCAKSVVNALLDLGAEITGSTSAAIQNIVRFKDLVMKCYNEEGNTNKAKCVVLHVKEFKEVISKLMEDATEIISILKDKGVILIDAVKSCSITRAQMALENIQNIKIKATQC